MKKVMLLVLFVLAFAGMMMAQNWSSTVDVLGAHKIKAVVARAAMLRTAARSVPVTAAQPMPAAMHCGDRTPAHSMAKRSRSAITASYVEVCLPRSLRGSQEVGGILLCLSCHDGNVTPTNMMQNWSYEQQIGLLTNTTYGGAKIPTLLGNDGTTARQPYTNDHPVGQMPPSAT